MEEDQQKKRTKLIIAVLFGVVLLFLIAGIVLWFLNRGDGSTTSSGGLLPFGNITETDRTPITGGGKIGRGNESGSDPTGEPMFRQLSSVPTAGAIAIVKDNEQYVRYMEKSEGHVYDVRIRDGEKTEITNTKILRVHEALFGLGGDAVITRSLDEDSFTKADIIKTTLGYIKPAEGEGGIGSIQTNINDSIKDGAMAVSVSPDGKRFFYLLPTEYGSEGTSVDLGTKISARVFQHDFSEWLPQILDNGDVILATKPSALVDGFAYRFSPAKHTFERILRNKEGLTVNADPTGENVLYAENVSGNIAFGVWNKAGVPGDEGIMFHDSPISLVTLPEKCAWKKDRMHILCGSFPATRERLPDIWYQGRVPLRDTFWLANTKTNELVFIADPEKEESAKQSFDVVNPLFSSDGNYFVFVNKNDETLWSMKIPESAVSGEKEDPLPPDLSPSELKDAVGSLPSTTTTR